MGRLIHDDNRFMRTRLTFLVVVVHCLASAQSGVGPDKTQANAGADRSPTVAQPGFYLKLSRCHACVPRQAQQDAMISFRGRGISAFYGSPVYDASYSNIEFLEKLQGVHGFPASLFVGPFQTDASAHRVISEVPSILT